MRNNDKDIEKELFDLIVEKLHECNLEEPGLINKLIVGLAKD